MTGRGNSRRRSPPAIIWLMVGIVVTAALAATTLGLVAWQEAQRVAALEAQVTALGEERQALEMQLVDLQSTVTALNSRLLSLEENDPGQQLAALEAKLETVNDSQEVAELRSSLAEIQEEMSAFQAMADGLAVEMESLTSRDAVASGNILPSEVRLTVARQQQQHNLSCESSAASMVANYHGVGLSEAKALASLPLNDNPYLGFRGNVDGPVGSIEDYGVYAGPIVTLLRNQGLGAWLVDGGLDGIRAAVARGNPVIAWVTYNCQPSTPVETIIAGETVTLVPYQHVVVVTGYSADGVWAIDPWDGLEDFYPRADFERAMGYFGDVAIEVAAP
jgi:uncharacterized protein YvpB